MNANFVYLFCFAFFHYCVVYVTMVCIEKEGVVPIRWCTYSDESFEKCSKLKEAVTAKTTEFTGFEMNCTQETSLFNCMSEIRKAAVCGPNIMTVESGIANFGAELYTLKPVIAESYSADPSPSNFDVKYYANVVVRKSSGVTVSNMGTKTLCSSGVGKSEGWTMVLSKLMQSKSIPVEQCNSLVVTITDYFKQMCLPGAMSSVFNKFGSNSDKSCSLCGSANSARLYCKYNDVYANSDGAMRCMVDRNADIAFVRGDEVMDYAGVFPQFVENDYQLLCADNTYKPLSDYKTCHWGESPSNIAVTSIQSDSTLIKSYRDFFGKLNTNFGTSAPNGTFQLYSSEGYGDKSVRAPRNLLFSDVTKNLYDSLSTPSNHPTFRDLSSIYNWLSKDYQNHLSNLRYCPLSDVRWCVISTEELAKCERMKLSFSAKSLKPDLNCIQGDNVIECMRLINKGLADVTNVDAGDLYVAGKLFGLVPFVSEFYGDSSHYFAVAIVNKPDKMTLISNLKNRRTCQSGVGKATGWVVPMNVVLDTRQITVLFCRLMHAYSELVSRACIPGIMDKEYNPTGHNPINLCENCAAGGSERCSRNNRELYYGDSGAFRCLLEGAGDVAFARHTTVFDNTAGHNPSHWARNRRSDDYELLCADGSRRAVGDWAQCNLGKIPGNVLVASGYKTERQRRTMWELLKYGQDFYTGDRKSSQFHMFTSPFDQTDLMFQDITESLMYIPPENQSYTAWLGQDFIRKIETLEWQSCDEGYSGIYNVAVSSYPSISSLVTLLTVSLWLLLVC